MDTFEYHAYNEGKKKKIEKVINILLLIITGLIFFVCLYFFIKRYDFNRLTTPVAPVGAVVSEDKLPPRQGVRGT